MAAALFLLVGVCFVVVVACSDAARWRAGSEEQSEVGRIRAIRSVTTVSSAIFSAIFSALISAVGSTHPSKYPAASRSDGGGG